MHQIITLSLALAVCNGLFVPQVPHSEYGIPLEYLRKAQSPNLSEQYGVPQQVLPVEGNGIVPTFHDSYGVPQAKEVAPVVTQYDYVIPHVEPVVTPAAEYGIPKVHDEYGVPSKPHDEYGVPKTQEVAPVVTQYDYVIPHVEPVVTPAAEYGIPKVHDEYGVPSKPHDEYGVPKTQEVAPVVTQYDYVIPHVEPVVTPAAEYGIPKVHDEYGVPAKPHDEYGVPKTQEVAPVVTQYDYVIPHVEPVVTPAAEYGIPKVHDEYGVPAKPHDEYGVPKTQEVAPVVTQYDYVIPHVEPVVTPAAEYGIPKVHDEYGVPAKPHDEYGVPKTQEVAPVVTQYDYVIPHVEPVVTPAAEYGIPKVHDEYGVPAKPSAEYGVPQIKEPTPVITQYEYIIPHVEPVVMPAAEYGIPKIHEEYGVPNKPHDEYGVPLVKDAAPIVTQYEYVIPHVEPAPVVPKIHEEYGVPNKPHDEYGVPRDQPEYVIQQAVKPVEIQYAYDIPHVEAPSVPKIHEDYGVPQVPVAVPHSEYGVPAAYKNF